MPLPCSAILSRPARSTLHARGADEQFNGLCGALLQECDLELHCAGIAPPRITTTTSGLNEVQAAVSQHAACDYRRRELYRAGRDFCANRASLHRDQHGGDVGHRPVRLARDDARAGRGDEEQSTWQHNRLTNVTGNAAGWEGYATKLRIAGSNSELYTRPAQNGATNSNQDLVFRNGVTGGYNSPAASIVGTNVTTGSQLTDGSTYTYALKITMAAGGVLDLVQNLYSGADTGTNIFTHTGQTTALQTIATQFDGLAFGYRATNDTTTPATEHVMNISLIKVDTNVALPASDNANFDGDTDVDGDDLLKWQRGFGLTGQTTIANGDANRNGTVDGADLAVWRSQFGNPPVSASSSVCRPSRAYLRHARRGLRGAVAAVRRRRD